MENMQQIKDLEFFGGRKAWTADGVSTDTRKSVAGKLFFALKGERFDAHNFIKDALLRQAAGVVINKERSDLINLLRNQTAVFSVNNTAEALGNLAHIIREKHGATVIAVTGSNGKTTTKEMIAQLLSRTYITGKTEGNFNNLIGLPLSILNMKQETDTWILELGTSRYGELAALTRIADPDIGIITNIGRTHLEYFGDPDGVAKAKSEIFSGMRSDTTAIINADDPLVLKIARRFEGKVLSAGFSADASLRILSYRLIRNNMEFETAYNDEVRRMSMPLWGRHYLQDMSLAILCARFLKVSWNDIETACSRFGMLKGRGTVLSYENGITVIDDTYNANPDSMREGFLSAIDRYGARNIIAVIGDMLELGNQTENQHRALGRFLTERGIHRFILTGKFSQYTLNGILSVNAEDVYAKQANDTDTVINELKTIAGRGSAIYIKGSRGMKLEDLISAYDNFMRGHNA